jgi:hypothetical protein
MVFPIIRAATEDSSESSKTDHHAPLAACFLHADSQDPFMNSSPKDKVHKVVKKAQSKPQSSRKKKSGGY